MRPVPILLVLLALILAGSPARAGAPGDGGSPTATDVAAAQAEFGWDLYRELAASPGENLFFSPASIALALSMTLAGAEGPTAAEMRSVLHYPAADDGLHRAAGELQAALARPVADPAEPDQRAFELTVANRLWVQDGFPLRDRFLTICDDHYGAGVGLVDFQQAPAAALERINGWVGEQTAGKIPDLLSAGAIRPQTTLVLTNAVYFLAQWAKPFQTERTEDRPFHVPGVGEVQVPTMRQSERLAYAADDQAQFLQLLYNGRRQVCEIVLPRERDGLEGLTATLTRDRLDTWRQAARPRTVDLELPRLDITGKFELADLLADLGMPSAFNAGRADFTSISTAAPLVIDRVIHQATVTMDEAGTEAAAATAITMLRTSVGPPQEEVVFHADHPFVFLIRDLETGTVLFLGRVMDPRA
jgi:serpin B